MSCLTFKSACVLGSQVIPVSVEVDIQPGLPLFRIIGLPDTQIREARERIRSAIKNSGCKMPASRITVNLTPAHLPKQGTMFDLAIALGILRKQLKYPDTTWIVGQLTLNGEMVVPNHLPAILIEAGKQKVQCITPPLSSSTLYCVTKQCSSLKEALTLTEDTLFAQPAYPSVHEEEERVSLYDQIVGQEHAKRVLQIALAGKHNFFMSGPPGSGKTMLATAAQQLLPDLSREEMTETIQLHSLAGAGDAMNHTIRPPLRTVSTRIGLSALYGSNDGKIGEISLAQHGILFLDEFPELSHSVREGLRQPLQERVVRIQHKGMTYIHPADCLVIAAQNECPCGLLGVPGQTCRCSAGDLQRYQRAISQPILDRFDLFCSVPHVDMAAYSNTAAATQGILVKEVVASARRIQYLRFGSRSTNSQMCPAEIKRYVPLDAKAKQYLERAATSLYLSVRGFDSILKVARTIADLEGKMNVELRHIQEATQYRHRIKTI